MRGKRMKTVTKWFTRVSVFFVTATGLTLATQEATIGERTTAVETAIGIRASGSLLLPPAGQRLAGIIVLVNWGYGSDIYKDVRWRGLAAERHLGLLLVAFGPVAESGPAEGALVRQAQAGSGDGLLTLLARFADDFGRNDIRTARLVFWGTSAGGNFGFTFAATHPNQTLAVVRHHSGAGNPAVAATLATSVSALRSIPMLMLTAEQAPITVSEEALWRSGRALDAPWTYAMQLGKAHGEGLEEAMPFMLAWTAGALQVTLDRSLSRIWRGVNRTLQIAPQAPARGSLGESWLPDESSARLGRLVSDPKVLTK